LEGLKFNESIYSRVCERWYFQLSYLKCLVTVLVDTHSLAVFKRRNRTEGKRAGAWWRSRSTESRVYQQAAHSIWGEKYVQSREPSFSLRTCVHPCLSRQEYRLWRTSPRVAAFRPFNLQRYPPKAPNTASKLLNEQNSIEIDSYKMIFSKIFLNSMLSSSRYMFYRNVFIRNTLWSRKERILL